MNPEITTVAPWFGSNRLLASRVGDMLSTCSWVGVPFAGGMSELAHIKARSIVVNDLHRHVINLARCIADDATRRDLFRIVDRLPFHPDTLTESRERCRHAAEGVEAAAWYFVSVWMNRSGKAGAGDEFRGSLPVRWTSSGGDSNTRYRSAVRSMVAWSRIVKRCNFQVMDAFDFLPKVKDTPATGIYCDPPFPGPGKDYLHNCGETEDAQTRWHVRLRDAVERFQETRVVCRFYDHPLIRLLYTRDCWEWVELTGRKQTNGSAPEILLIRN